MLSHWRVPSFTAPMLSLSLISQREGKVKITGKALIFPFNIWVKFVFFSSNLLCFLSLISQTCHVRDELLTILPLIYLILLHGPRHKKIPPWLLERRDYFGSRSWRVSRKIKAVIAKNWYCFFAIIFSFARSCNNENNVVDS
jgi:hypothetical protein